MSVFLKATSWKEDRGAVHGSYNPKAQHGPKTLHNMVSWPEILEMGP